MSDINLNRTKTNPYNRATDRMISFSAAIAKALHLNPPDYMNFKETSEFINTHIEEYNNLPYEAKHITDSEGWHEYNGLLFARANISTEKLHNLISRNIVPLLDNHKHPFENGTDLSDEDRDKLAETIIESRFEYTNRIDSIAVSREEFIKIVSDYIIVSVEKLKEKHYDLYYSYNHQKEEEKPET